jgi:hypothetical protein
VEIFVLESLFQSHNFAVGGSYNNVLCVALELTSRGAEKIENEEIYYSGY